MTLLGIILPKKNYDYIVVFLNKIKTINGKSLVSNVINFADAVKAKTEEALENAQEVFSSTVEKLVAA